MATRTVSASRGVLFDAAGRPVRLGSELGRGGEASVFDVDGAPDVVAKLYHRPPDADKRAKLATMPRLASPALLGVAAWPTNSLHESPGAPATGVLMPRASGAEVHRLYSPAHRKAEFPNYDWEKLIVVAHNVAAAVARIHEAGHVVGDVNQGNVLVSPTGVVRLIDCDSFQIRDGDVWRLCEVGVAHFTPPELQGTSFRGVVRTQNHDAFGLAVLVFHLLFMGRHPFAGRYGGRGDMPLEQAIAEFRFAFGRNAAAVQMAPPPNALPLASASRTIADLFERAFSASGVQPGGRATAAQWAAALNTVRLELARCAKQPGHKYHRALGPACPWCAIEHAGGPDFFVSVAAAMHAAMGGFDLQKVWAEVTAVPAPVRGLMPPAAPPLPLATLPVSPARIFAWKAQKPAFWLAGLALLGYCADGADDRTFLLALLLFVGGIALRGISGLARERQARASAVKDAEAALKPLEEQWRREVESTADRFEARRIELTALHAEYLALDGRKRREREQLEAQRRDRQLHQFLERHYIDQARLRGIGPTLTATLASYGIETAADVMPSAIYAVPGFGAARASALIDWRDEIESRFVFDPRRGVDPRDVAALEQRYATRRQEIERALAMGASELRRLRGAAEQVVERLGGEMARCQQELALAQANLQAAG